MNRADLSKPPTDAALLTDIVRDALADPPHNALVSIPAMVREVMRQCPGTIGAAEIVEEVVRQAASAGVAIEFDK